MTDIAIDAPIEEDGGFPTAGAPPAEWTRTAVAVYRRLHELPGGPFPQVQGLLPEDAARALTDPRTVVAPLATPEGTVDVPVLTPIELVDWYSPEFRAVRFGELLRRGATVWHLSTFPSLDDIAYGALLDRAAEGLRERHPGPFVVFVDHAERGDDPSGERLPDLFETHLPGAVEELLGTEGPAREHYLAGVLSVGDGGRVLHPIDLRTVVTGPTDDAAFLDELWAIYETPFRRLAEQTPLRTYFEQDELGAAIRSDGAIQTYHRVQGRLVSWMMMTSNIGSFPWMDPMTFRAIDPTIPPELIHVFPGLVTDEAFHGNNCADKLINEATFALEQRGSRHLIVFETVDENLSFLPQLIEEAVAGTGYGTLKFHRVGAQAMRAWVRP